MDEYVAAERSDYVSWGYDDYAKEDEIYWLFEYRYLIALYN